MNELDKKRDKDLKALIEGKLDEYGATKKTLYSLLGIFACLFFTVVLSVTGMTFTPEVFATWTYWVAMITQFGLAIFAMITGRQVGDDTNRNKMSGRYRKQLSKYGAEMKLIQDENIRAGFDPWLIDYRNRKRVEKIRSILTDWNIHQFEVLDLDPTEVDKLSKPFKKDWSDTGYAKKYSKPTYFRSLTKDQIEVVKAILDGKVNVPSVPSSYFMDALKESSVDEWDKASKSEGKKSVFLASSYVFRIIAILAIDLALEGLQPESYGNGQGSVVALNIAKRVFVVLSSFVWGVYLGMKIVDMDTVYLAYKTLILTSFREDVKSGKWKMESVEEKAKREYDALNPHPEDATITKEEA